MDIDVCVDCLMFAANGLLPDDNPDDFLARVNERWDGWRLAPGDGDGYFSWRSCDGCGSHLGGDRFTVHAFQ